MYSVSFSSNGVVSQDLGSGACSTSFPSVCLSVSLSHTLFRSHLPSKQSQEQSTNQTRIRPNSLLSIELSL